MIILSARSVQTIRRLATAGHLRLVSQSLTTLPEVVHVNHRLCNKPAFVKFHHLEPQRRNYSTKPATYEVDQNRNTSDSSTSQGLVPQTNQYTYRTHNCGELNASHVGQSVTLCGWLQFQRMKKFFTLRDGYGETQVIVPPELADIINTDAIPYESILKVEGVVQLRPAGQNNSKMSTGEIEVHLKQMLVLNEARPNLPMEVRGHNRAKESTRLEYRYIDLRFADMQRNLRMRSAILMRMREFLINHAGFVEVETPTLFRRTPGGAQEFVVPTRKAGHFYSLVQSPQQFKQMLMSGAVDRYFQIARCYRDESTRPDRQPEFTQLDIELSFTDRESIMELIENLMLHCLPSIVVGKVHTPFARMSYTQAMEEYGCDKPDIRFDMKLQNVTSIFKSNPSDSFAAYALVVPIDPKHKYPKAINESMSKIASEYNIKFAAIRLNKEPDNWAKHNKVYDLSTEQLNGIFAKLNAKRNDTIFLAFGPKNETQTLLGRVRLAAIEHLEQAQIVPIRSNTDYKFLWIVDFPMFASPDNPSEPLETVHHPFTAPHPEDTHLLQDPSAHTRIRSQSYDLVLNGWEVGGGSIRIHQAAMQKQVLDDILQIDHSHLNHLLDALATGCPPHGGIALGLDRLLTIICGAASMRDVMAFPKGAEGKDPLSKAPVPISEEELTMYNIRVRETSAST